MLIGVEQKSQNHFSFLEQVFDLLQIDVAHQ